MTVPESTPRDDTESPADQQQRLLSPWERTADNAFLALLNAADDYADGDLIVGNLYALHSAVTAVWKGDMEYLQAERDTARNRVTALEAAVQHFAAEAHRRKWAHQDSIPAAFEELHRIGNELLAALPAPKIPACLTSAPKAPGGES
jgi:hypothetical protein